MIKTKDAIRIAREQIGTPYGTGAGQLDCINLIKRVIRDADGGVKDYTTAGTNSLWESYNMSRKYKDLTWRQESIVGARAGMIAFKRYGTDDEGHAGIVTDAGTVIHASGPGGKYDRVVETPLTSKEGWDLLAIHRYIEVGEAEKGDIDMEGYTAYVTLNNPDSHLNVRKAPKTGDIIGRLGDGAQVIVQAKSDGWAFVSYGDSGVGYVSEAYLTSEPLKGIEDVGVTGAPGEPGLTQTALIRESDGMIITLGGVWRVAVD